MNASDTRPRVVITGLGLVTPLGIGLDSFAEKLAAGQSGISQIEQLDFSASPDNIGGEVKDFTDSAARKQYLRQHRKSIKVMCREIQLGVAAAMQALEHCGADLEQIDHQRFGVEFGANLMFSPPSVLKDACWRCVDEDDPEHNFQYSRWGNDGLPAMEPLWLLRYLPNMPACHIGIAADARGPNNSITLDDASGNLVLGEAMRVIGRGAADVMIAGTTGTRLHPVKTIHARFWDNLATGPAEPERRCRPFDADRQGDVIGEGAAAFILETEEHAQNRGAEIYGAILGAGSSCVLNRDGQPDLQRALAQAARAALRDAGLEPSDIGHVSAHASGSRSGDLSEARAIREVFGENTDVPVTAFKSYVGNSGSGSGTLELAASLTSLRQGVIYPTLNCDAPDPECGLNVVAGQPLSTSNKRFLNLSVTRIGQASATVVEAA